MLDHAVDFVPLFEESTWITTNHGKVNRYLSNQSCLVSAVGRKGRPSLHLESCLEFRAFRPDIAILLEY